MNYLFQDGVIWAIYTQFPDLMVVGHYEKRLFSWNEEQMTLENEWNIRVGTEILQTEMKWGWPDRALHVLGFRSTAS